MAERFKPPVKEEAVTPVPDDLAGITQLLDVGNPSYNPDEAARRIQSAVSAGQTQAVEKALAAVAPLIQNQGMAKLTAGLTDEGKAFAEKFVQEKGINPAFLNDPVIADLVRSKAELHQMSTKQKEIPATEGVKPIVANIDAETNRQLTSLKGLYESLGVPFDGAKLVQRMAG